jgi:hypothetical protein
LLYTVNENGEKPDRNHTPSLGFMKSIQKPQVRELSRLCPETSTKFYVHEFGLRPNYLQCVPGFGHEVVYLPDLAENVLVPVLVLVPTDLVQL